MGSKESGQSQVFRTERKRNERNGQHERRNKNAVGVHTPKRLLKALD